MARHRDETRTRATDAGRVASNGAIGLLIGLLVGGGAVVAGAKLANSNSNSNGTAPDAKTSVSAAPVLTDCETTTKITAVAPTVVVPMLQAAAAKDCIELDLTEAGGRDGVRASAAADLWITDSSLWATASAADPGAPTSIASSPVVGIVTPATAKALDHKISWPTLLSPDRPVRLGFHDPSTTASGLLGAWPFLVAERQVSAVRYEALAFTARSLSQPSTVGTSVLADPPAKMLVLAGEYLAQANDHVRVVRGVEGEPYFDFPAYNLSHDPASRAAVAGLISRLASADQASARADAQLRDPDGTAEFDTTFVGEATQRMELPNRSSTIKLYGLGASGNIPGRILVMLNVSSSMNALQPNGEPLIDSVRNTALVAMGTLADHTSVGVWLYGNKIDGTNDHTELVPITPLGTGRQQVIDSVGGIQVSPNSGTGLYRTVLDGYSALQQDYDPAAAQSLVIFTDSSKDATSGMSLQTLETKLKAQSKPDQHIRIMGVGFGPDSEVKGLAELSGQFGGKSSRVKGPVALLGLFLTMIGQVAAEG